MKTDFGYKVHVYYLAFQRSRPKSLIDLNYTSLYPVHDSFFGRWVPIFFQLGDFLL
jgi:Ras GTPase-activating protein 1